MGIKLWLVKHNKYQWPGNVVSRMDETKLEVKMFDKVGKIGKLRIVEQTNVQPYLYDDNLKKKVAESNNGSLKSPSAWQRKLLARMQKEQASFWMDR